MDVDGIRLTATEIEFLKFKFDTEDPDEAVELFVELLVFEGKDPMEMKFHILDMMLREQC